MAMEEVVGVERALRAVRSRRRSATRAYRALMRDLWHREETLCEQRRLLMLALRDEHRVTGAEVARRLGVSRQRVYQLLR